MHHAPARGAASRTRLLAGLLAVASLLPLAPSAHAQQQPDGSSPHRLDAGELVCDDSARAPEVPVVYVAERGRSRLAQRRADIVAQVVRTQRAFDVSSGRNGGRQALLPRFAATDDCRLRVRELLVDFAVRDDVDSVAAALTQAGYGRRDLPVVVLEGWATGASFCGMALSDVDDDRPDPRRNHNGLGPGRIDPLHLGAVDADCTDVITHELVHAMGGPTSSAPHLTAFGGGHVTDAHDVMAYTALPGSPFEIGRCRWEALQPLLDCGADDYFDPDPAPGSFLATHWNVARSPWLFRAPLGATLQGGRVDRLPPRRDRVAPVPVATDEVCAATGDGGSPRFADTDGGLLDPAIRCVAAAGIAQGFPDGTFRPGARLTRGQTAAFLVRTLELAGVPLPSPSGAVYRDDDGTLFERDLSRLARLDVPVTSAARITGLRSTPRTIRPARSMTRAEMAEWVGGALIAADGSSSSVWDDWPQQDAFVDDEGHELEPFVNTVARAGIVTGVGADRFAPDRPLTRGEMAVFLTRLLAHLRA